MFQKLIKLKKSGFLKEMVKTGLMSSKVYVYLEIYMWVDARKKATGRPLIEIVALAQAEFGISERTVYRAIRTIKTAH